MKSGISIPGKYHLGGDMSKHFAPNGKPSNLTHEQWHLVRTPEFKAWFGDWEKLALVKHYDSGIDEVTLASLSKDVSKVLDSNGEPLVVYHGQHTGDKIHIFNSYEGKGFGGWNRFGFWFTNELGYAKAYATSNFTERKYHNVYECFLNIRTPLELKGDKGFDELENLYVLKTNVSFLSKAKKEDNDKFREYLKNSNMDGVFIESFSGDSSYSEYYDANVNQNIFVALDSAQIKLADGTNVTFDTNNPDIRYAGGGEVEDLISKGIVELKMYETTPEHAREYGIISINPLYIQTICVNNDSRLKGIGKKVLAYIDEYARKNGNDVVFGHITQKAEFTKDERQNFFCDVDLIKNWLFTNGYAINNNNNDFHKVIQKNVRYNNGGKMKKSISDGGITYGPSHEKGGIKVHNKSTNQMLEVEGGESVINKRSMASGKQVELNGDKMTICEAASELNEMGGGVKFDCADVEGKQFLNNGGELAKGIATEKEHIGTLKKLYQKKITPAKATIEIAKEHISEDPKYYSKLKSAIKKHITKCSCHNHKYSNGGMMKSYGSFDDLVSKTIQDAGLKNEEQEAIELTLSKGRELLDIDYLSVFKEKLPTEYQKYLDKYSTLNLYKLGWRFQFGTSREWAGLCAYGSPKIMGQSEVGKNIYVSVEFTKYDKNWRQNYQDVILHEMAHAFVNELFNFNRALVIQLDPEHALTKGHGKIWKMVCDCINANCSQYYRNADLKDKFMMYKYICGFCGEKKFSNAPNFTKNCFKCYKPVFIQKNS